MNNIFDNTKCDTYFLKSYQTILKNKQVVNHRDRTRTIIQESTEELAFNFQNKPADIDDIFTCLKHHLQANSAIFASAFAFSPEISLSCPFVFRDSTEFKSRDIAKEVVYSNAIWYEVPIKQRKAIWSVPYFDIGKAGEDILLTTYSVPIFNLNSNLVGVVISDLLLARLQDMQK